MTDFFNNFDKIEFPHLGYIKIPQIPFTLEELNSLKLPLTATSEDVLYTLAKKGFNEKLRNKQIPKERIKEYQERLRFEFEQIKKLMFIDYLILVYKIIDFCRNNDILNDHGRGSCCSSLLLFCLNVTKVDPIKHGLLFERFISSARTEVKEIKGELYISSSSVPDVDIDSMQSKKHKINEYIEGIFPKRTAAILTFTTLQSKALLKEVYKCVEGVDEPTAKSAAEFIETKFGTVDSLEETYNKNEGFKTWAQSHLNVYNISQKLQYLIKNKSVHPSGIMLCQDELSECMPIELTSDKKIVTTYDMEKGQLIGIKVDNLGLKNLDIVHDCLKMINKNLDNIDVNDKTIYSFLEAHKDSYYGIFQIEDGLGKKVVHEIKPKNIEDIAICLATGRPGSMSFLNDLVQYRNTGIGREIDNKIADILNPTGNVILYQETIMKLAERMADFNPQEKDGIRKAIGKKLKDKMASYKEKFVSGSLKNGYSQEFIDSIWKTFEDSASYSFNKCIFEEETVEKDDGEIVMLKDLKIGDKIKSYNLNNNSSYYVTIKNIYYNNKEVFQVLFKNNSKITTSLEHKFLCSDLQMRQLKDVISNDYEIICKEGKTKIYSVQYFGYKKTIDLEVDCIDHNFFCNDICVSNSHAVAYGYLTCVTAYLKANYMLEYFLCSLERTKNEQNPMEELAIINKEMNYFGLKLLKPHITKSKLNFSVENGNIRFGLSSIKGIAEKSLGKLSQFCKEYSNKFEIFEAAYNHSININILCALIQSGAFEGQFIQSRSKIVYEAQLWNILTEKEKQLAINYASNFEYDLVKTIKALNQKKNEKGIQFIKDSRLQTIIKKQDSYKQIYELNSKSEKFANWYYEKKLLGYSYDTTLKEIFLPKNSNLINIQEIKTLSNNEKVIFVASVKENSERRTSKAGNPYIAFDCHDESGEINVKIFNKSLESSLQLNNQKTPKEDNIVIVEGQKKGDDCIFGNLYIIQTDKIYTKFADLKKEQEEKLDEKDKKL